MRRLLSLILVLPALFACGPENGFWDGTNKQIYEEICGKAFNKQLPYCHLIATHVDPGVIDHLSLPQAFVIKLNRALDHGGYYDAHNNHYFVDEDLPVIKIIQPTESIQFTIYTQQIQEGKNGELFAKINNLSELPSLKPGKETIMQVELTDWGGVVTTSTFNLTVQ